MIHVVPSHNHPVYVEWAKWRHRNEKKWTPEGQAAIESIQRIAEYLYPGICIVGHMIIMDDLEQMEAESLAEDSPEQGEEPHAR